MAFGEPHGARYLGDGTVPSTASEEEVQAALRDWLREAGDVCHVCGASYADADGQDRAMGGDGLDRDEWRDDHADQCRLLRREVVG